MKKFKDFLDEYWRLLIFILCVFIFSPSLTNFFVSKDFGFIGDKSDWISFSGGLLGSSLTILGVFIQLEFSKNEKLEIERKEKIAVKNRELKCQIEQINDFLFNEYIFKFYNVNIHYHHLKNNVLSDSRFDILEDPIERTDDFISLEYGDRIRKRKYILTIEEGNYFQFLKSLQVILKSESFEKSMIFKKEKLETFLGQFKIMIILMLKLLENATDEEVLYIKTTLLKYGDAINLLDEFSLIDENILNQYQQLKYFPTENLFEVDPHKKVSKKLKETVIKELNNLNVQLKIQDIRKIKYELSENIPIIMLETKDAIYKRKPEKIGLSYAVESSIWEKKIK